MKPLFLSAAVVVVLHLGVRSNILSDRTDCFRSNLIGLRSLPGAVAFGNASLVLSFEEQEMSILMMVQLSSVLLTIARRMI